MVVWGAEADELDTGEDGRKVANIAGAVVGVGHNSAACTTVDTVEEAENRFVEVEHVLATKEGNVGECLSAGNDWIALVLACDKTVALGYEVQ